MTRRRMAGALRVACYALVVGLLGWQVWRVRSGLAESLRTVGPTRVAVCVALTSIAWIPGFFSWRLVLAGLGTRLPLPVAYRMRFVAMLTNYVPGGVWPAVALAVQARQRGLPPARFAGSFVAGHALAVLAGLVVGLLALPVLAAAHPAWWLLLPAVAAGLVPVAAPRLLRALLEGARRLLRRGAGPVPLPDRWTLAGATGLAAAGWLLAGLHVAVLTAAFGVGAGPALAVGIGGFALSVVAGGVSFVLPQGLGAREVALALVLTTLLTGPALVTVVALSRVVVTAGEALGMAAGFGVLLRQRKTAVPAPRNPALAEAPVDGRSG